MRDWNSIDVKADRKIVLAAVSKNGFALQYADASKLAPFGYFEIIPNIILGYYLFNDMLDIWSFTGLFIIIFSGLYVIRREYNLKIVNK